MTAYRKLPRSDAGVALLEALVSILIFSVAIIGLLGMQALSVKNSIDSKNRADASYFADQIIGRIWADRATIGAYAHHPAGAPCAPSGAASANTNVTLWLNAVARALPGAPANLQQITVDAVTNQVTVAVCWKLPQEPAYHNFVEVAQVNG
jgi:type IV pilus assembly protein PilV